MRILRAVPVLVVVVGLALIAVGPRRALAFLGVGPTFVLSFKNLSTNVMPNAFDDDGDSKDVVIKARASFKASKGSEVGLNKRMKLKSKVDGGQAAVATEVEMTGNVTARLRVAISSIDGLVDGVTLGFLERRTAGGGPVQRLEAVWNAGLLGFTIRALDDGTPTGDTLDLPDATEAVLSIVDGGTDFVLHAGEPVGESITDLAPEADLATLEQAKGTESAVFAFGAVGLGQKAILWFGQFTLEFGTDIALSEPEMGIGGDLVSGHQFLWAAQELLDSGASGQAAVQEMYNLLYLASIEIGDAWDALLLALDQDTLQPWTQGVDAEKNIKGSLGWVFPASLDMFDEMQDGGTNIQKVKSHVKVGLKKLGLGMAQMAGFKSNSAGKLEKTLDFSMP